MSQNKKSNFFYGLVVIALATLIVVSIISAWTEPGSAPPGGNVPAPINVGSDPQYKSGALGIGGLTVDYGVNLATLGGNVGIGPTTPGYKLDVNGDINLAAGSVYRVGGVAQSGSSKWTAGTGDNIYRSVGNVGIGTISPNAKIDVREGKVRIEAIPAGTTGSYTWDKDRFEICQFGTCCPPWKDCDGDGKTYQDGNDCDEGCPTCYYGSTYSTLTPDGKDQDCNGIVDEVAWVNEALWGMDGGCNFVKAGSYPYFWGESGVCEGYSDADHTCWTIYHWAGTWGTELVCGGRTWRSSYNPGGNGDARHCHCTERQYR